MADGDVDAALQHRDVLRRRTPPRRFAPKRRSTRSAMAATSGGSKSVRAISSMSTMSDVSGFSQAKNGSSVSSCSSCDGLTGATREGVVVLRGVDQRAMQREEGFRDLAQRGAQRGPLRRVRRVHRSRVEGFFVERHGPETSRLHGWLGKGG